ncbi:MAG: SRPBCC family protein [Hyphomonadaceae bacterium]
MLKFIGIAALVVVLAIVGLFGFALTQPDTFHVARSIRIAAPAARIYAHIDDFRAWNAWSPYERLDPAMQRVYGGAKKGVGARYAWSGNDKAGQGRMQIVDAAAPTKLVVRLEFVKPFPANNIVTFGLEEKSGETTVTWSMDGPQPLIARVMCLFIDMDEMIGKDFSVGLANLKAISES